MTRIFILLCLIALIFSCKENQPAAEKLLSYSSDTLKLSFLYPDNWEVLPHPADPYAIALVMKKTDEKKTYQPNMVWHTEVMPIAITDSVYQHASMTQLKIANSGLQLKKNNSVKLGENLFKTFTAEFSAEGKSFEARYFCLVKKNTGYMIACTALKSDMPAYLQKFKDIISTFST